MGLTLVVGGAGTGKSFYCREAIRERLQQSPEGNPLLLILPEHATFQSENDLAATPGLQGFTRAHVFGFQRLAHRVLLETGGALRPHITELGKKLVLSRLLQEHQAEFTVFRQAAGQRSFAETLAGIIKEFKSYAVKPEDLLTVKTGMPPSPLADKLHDLYILYHDFEVFLQSRYTDPEDYLNLLAENINRSSLVQGAEVWLDGFVWFNPREMAVLKEILTTAAEVTVTLCLPPSALLQPQSETSLFYRQWNTRRKLRELAAATGAAVREVPLQESRRFADNPALAHLERQFFSYPVQPWRQPYQDIALVEAANRRTEVEGMARDMIRLCREGNCRWRDIAVLLRDTESYNDIVERVLADYGIPFFSDRRRLAVHHPLAELLRSALETLTENWSYEPLFRCLKTDFFPLARAEVDQLENYVLEFGIRGTRWSKPEPWRFMRRLSLGEEEELSDEQLDYLDSIHAIRMTASGPLLKLSEGLQAAASVRELTTVLYYFLEELSVPETLENWADKDEQAGDVDSAREHRQIWSAVVELLEQLVETCGDEALKPADFAAVLNDGLENLRLSLIPPGLDHVTIASLEQNTVDNIPAVYVLGANDGVLPMRGRSEGVLTDKDREDMAARGMELAPGALADTFAERYLIYLALTRSRQHLWFSYPLADEEGKGLAPSLVIKRLRQLLNQAPLFYLPAEPPEGCEYDYVAQPERSIAALVAAIRQYKAGRGISPVWWAVYNWALQCKERNGYLSQALGGLFHQNQAADLPLELAVRLYPRNRKIRGSVTRLESFQACPFKHFAQYGLHLRERPVFRLQPLDLGQFLHSALKAFGDHMEEKGLTWGALTPAEYGDLCGNVVQQLIPRLQNEILLSSGQYRHLTRRLENTVKRSVERLAEFDRVSHFKPVALEKAFGQGSDALPPLVYPLPDGVVMELVGQIDRLDSACYNGICYLLVIDYKSGGAWISLPEVYYGLKLQLLTYLLAAQKAGGALSGAGECRPAGVLYYFLKNPSISGQVLLPLEEIKKTLNNQLKMPGWVLADQDIIRLLDQTMDSRSDFLKVALKKDGTVYSSSLAYVKTTEEFSLLLRHVEATLAGIGEQIMRGRTGIEPYQLGTQTACSYCRYSPVCQFDQSLPDNDYRILKQLEETQIWRKLTGRGDAE